MEKQKRWFCLPVIIIDESITRVLQYYFNGQHFLLLEYSLLVVAESVLVVLQYSSGECSGSPFNQHPLITLAPSDLLHAVINDECIRSIRERLPHTGDGGAHNVLFRKALLLDYYEYCWLLITSIAAAEEEHSEKKRHSHYLLDLIEKEYWRRIQEGNTNQAAKHYE